MAGYRKHRGMDPADEARFLQVGRGVTVSHSTTGFEKTRRRSMSYAKHPFHSGYSPVGSAHERRLGMVTPVGVDVQGIVIVHAARDRCSGRAGGSGQKLRFSIVTTAMWLSPKTAAKTGLRLRSPSRALVVRCASSGSGEMANSDVAVVRVRRNVRRLADLRAGLLSQRDAFQNGKPV